MEQQGYITMSIDDGHPTDLRTAELLQKFGLKATFYIPSINPEREVMSPHEIRKIAQHFEVGAHTLNHKPLKYLSDREASFEIHNGKKWLEDVIGNDVISFCYPQGKFHSGSVKLVQKAGFLGARTCMFNLYGFPKNPFLFGVSTHGYSHSVAIQIRHALLEKNFQGALNFIFINKLAQDWSEHYSYAVDFVEKHGGIAHLYFHSWEIDHHGQWEKLKSLLEYISKNTKLTRMTNGELFELWHDNKEAHIGDAL
jgi:peptidoglycan/xylan/chitin deacetylase (PgdA/CDA1 family)